MNLAPGTGAHVLVADQSHLVRAVQLPGVARHARRHQRFTCARRAGHQVHALVGQGRSRALQGVAQLLGDGLHGLLRQSVVFQCVQHQRTQFLGNRCLRHGFGQSLDFRGKLQIALPAGGLLTQSKLTAQRGQLVAYQVDDFAATQVVAGIFVLALDGCGMRRAGRRLPFGLAQGVHEIQWFC